MGAALKQVLRDRPGLANRAGIPAPLLDCIARDLLRIDIDRRIRAQSLALVGWAGAAAPASELPARLLAYVVDGDEPQVLAQIQASHGYSICSHDQDAKARGVRWQIYDRWEDLPPTVLLRLSRVLAAVSGFVASTAALDLSAQHPWVETLVRDLVGLPVSHRLFSETSWQPTARPASTASPYCWRPTV